MKKFIYINGCYHLEDELFLKYERMRDAHLVLTGSAPMSRVTPIDEFKVIHPIPSVPTHNISFAEATDMRVQQAIEQARTHDLPIVAMFSGGIDSTVIMTAVMKYFPQDLKDRLVVRMTNASYVENPTFFNNVINKNNIAYSSDRSYNYNNAMILHGDPADALWLGGNVLDFNAAYPNSHNKSLKDAEGIVIEWLTKRTDKQYAEWLFPFLQQEASSVGLELKTVSDFFWWIIFNYNFPLMCLKHAGEVSNPQTDINYANYEKNQFMWYASDEYQIWSIQAQYAQSKFDGTVRSYKMEAKEYIYEYDKNQWYRDYKTKVHSQYWKDDECKAVAAIYEDGEVLMNRSAVSRKAYLND